MNEILIHAVTWMSVENVLQYEISQLQKTTYYVIPLLCNVWNRQIVETERRLVVTWG